MTPQLFSVEQAPAALPYWQTIWDDLGRPPAKRIARVLGIGERSVYRYHRNGHAPRVVLLALFWLTRWGRSAVHTQATNDALMAVSLVRGLERRIGELSAQVSHLERLGGHGTANEPLIDGTPRGLPDGRYSMPEGHGGSPVPRSLGRSGAPGGHVDNRLPASAPAGRESAGRPADGACGGPGWPGDARPAEPDGGPQGPRPIFISKP